MTQGVSITLEEARHLKETRCYARARKSKWVPTEKESFLLQGESKVMPSSGKVVVLTTERYTIPEALLTPRCISNIDLNRSSSGSSSYCNNNSSCERGGGKNERRRKLVNRSTEEIKSIVELASMAMEHVRIPHRDIVLYTLGGGMAFRDLNRRLEKDLKSIGVTKVTSLGKFGAWKCCSSSGEGCFDDWILDINNVSKTLQRMKRKVCTSV
jgi:hypothetical protein